MNARIIDGELRLGAAPTRVCRRKPRAARGSARASGTRIEKTPREVRASVRSDAARPSSATRRRRAAFRDAPSARGRNVPALAAIFAAATSAARAESAADPSKALLSGRGGTDGRALSGTGGGTAGCGRAVTSGGALGIGVRPGVPGSDGGGASGSPLAEAAASRDAPVRRCRSTPRASRRCAPRAQAAPPDPPPTGGGGRERRRKSRWRGTVGRPAAIPRAVRWRQAERLQRPVERFRRPVERFRRPVQFRTLPGRVNPAAATGSGGAGTPAAGGDGTAGAPAGTLADGWTDAATNARARRGEAGGRWRRGASPPEPAARRVPSSLAKPPNSTNRWSRSPVRRRAL